MHVVRLSVFPIWDCAGRELSVGSSQAAQIQGGLRFTIKNAKRKQSDAQGRVAEIRGHNFTGALRREFSQARMEQRFQINQDGMFTGRDEVFAMKVRRL